MKNLIVSFPSCQNKEGGFKPIKDHWVIGVFPNGKGNAVNNSLKYQLGSV